MATKEPGGVFMRRMLLKTVTPAQRRGAVRAGSEVEGMLTTASVRRMAYSATGGWVSGWILGGFWVDFGCKGERRTASVAGDAVYGRVVAGLVEACLALLAGSYVEHEPVSRDIADGNANRRVLRAMVHRLCLPPSNFSPIEERRRRRR